MKRSLLVQTLLDMATGSGGAKLEALVVDAAGTFDAGSGKGYNPVTVPSGSINVLGEKGVVSNNSVVVTPKAQVVGGWLNSGETSGSGVGVTASELVSGTLNVSSDGVQDVTNYQNISVPSAGHSASASKSAVVNNSVTITPRSTATRGFVQEGTVEGTSVSVSVDELTSGAINITANGSYDVTNYKMATVNAQATPTMFTVTLAASSTMTSPVIDIPVEYQGKTITSVSFRGNQFQSNYHIEQFCSTPEMTCGRYYETGSERYGPIVGQAFNVAGTTITFPDITKFQYNGGIFYVYCV